MSKHRYRLHLSAQPFAEHIDLRWHDAPDSASLAYIARVNEYGRLLRKRAGGLVMQLQDGAFASVDHRKAEAALVAMAVTIP